MLKPPTKQYNQVNLQNTVPTPNWEKYNRRSHQRKIQSRYIPPLLVATIHFICIQLFINDQKSLLLCSIMTCQCIHYKFFLSPRPKAPALSPHHIISSTITNYVLSLPGGRSFIIWPTNNITANAMLEI